jgi:hypothetical protein
MAAVSTEQLKQVVESEHGGRAVFVTKVPVKRFFGDYIFWKCIVHVFNLEGHTKATIAYAWSSSVECSDKRRFYAVLNLGDIRSPFDAVRVSIGARVNSPGA